MNIFDGLRQQAKLNPDNPAISCGQTSYNYKEFHDRVVKLGNALLQLGVHKGDRVASLLLNCHRYLEIYYATALIGAVVVPLNHRLAGAELKYIMDDSDAETLFVDDDLLPQIEPVFPELEKLRTKILTSDASGIPGDMLGYESLISIESTKLPKIEVTESDLGGIFYTGGTTGFPKGVMLSQGNLVANATNVLINIALGADEVYCHAAPMFHLANGGSMYAYTIHGAKHTFLKTFEPKSFLEVVQAEKVTAIVLVPTMVNFVVNFPEVKEYDLSSLRRFTYGASPMPVELLKNAIPIFDCDIMQGYGMTEASPLLTVLRPEDHHTEGPEKLTRRLLSCGREILGVEVRVVNEKGDDVQPGEIGEIIARGANIMQGYWNKEKETKEVLKNGWYYSGDMGTVDEEEYIFLVDRKKDMIISGGENIYSTEVENAIYTHPSVLEAAVIGIPDKKWGEAVKGVVVLKPEFITTAEEIIQHCKEQIASFKVPKTIDFMNELPKSGAGKILKKDLREKYWGDQNRRIH